MHLIIKFIVKIVASCVMKTDLLILKNSIEMIRKYMNISIGWTQKLSHDK